MTAKWRLALLTHRADPPMCWSLTKKRSTPPDVTWHFEETGCSRSAVSIPNSALLGTTSMFAGAFRKLVEDWVLIRLQWSCITAAVLCAGFGSSKWVTARQKPWSKGNGRKNITLPDRSPGAAEFTQMAFSAAFNVRADESIRGPGERHSIQGCTLPSPACCTHSRPCQSGFSSTCCLLVFRQWASSGLGFLSHCPY